jgi:hypothetical protein
MHAAPVTPVAAAQDFLSWERSGAVELEYITDAESGEALNTLTTLALRNKWTLGRDGSGGAIVLNTRLWSDAEHPAAAAADHIEKLVGYLEIPYESLMLQAGQMEIQWGENLFMPVLDVVNQRDVNHPRGYYDPAAKVPARMLNAEWGTQDLSLQVIYIPTPQPLRQPEEVAGFKVATSDRHEPYRDAEYGGRFGLQLAGIDARIYHFRHWARVPAYTFTAFSGQGDLAQEDRLSETNGLSFSYAGYSWLLRGDLARHTAFPATSIGTAVEWSPLTQAILGMQWTTGGGQSVSGELHHDHWDEEPAAWSDGAFVATTKAPRDLTWVVLSANMTFFSGKFEPVLLAMRGIQKSDLLVRAIPVWNATESLSLALELQKTRAESNSPKLLLDQRETVSFRASWSF